MANNTLQSFVKMNEDKLETWAKDFKLTVEMPADYHLVVLSTFPADEENGGHPNINWGMEHHFICDGCTEKSVVEVGIVIQVFCPHQNKVWFEPKIMIDLPDESVIIIDLPLTYDSMEIAVNFIADTNVIED